MASTASSVSSSYRSEKVVDFAPTELQAPFFLRCAAIFIDYMVLLAIPVGWLLIETLLGDGTKATVSRTVWFIGIIFWLVNFLLLPLFRGQSIRKMLTGLTIVNLDGTRVGIGGIIRRNIFGYIITVATLGLGLLFAGVNTSGRALHDIIAGTIVVHGRKKQL
ncbi:MAG: RDD family protein [Chloracidobacterium sp.]|nr:RDD family protein [Chloracidobacterium sp.]